MEKTIVVEIKSVYGVERFYAKTHSKAIEMLTGTKTLSNSHLHALTLLGFEIEAEKQFISIG